METDAVDTDTDVDFDTDAIRGYALHYSADYAFLVEPSQSTLTLTVDGVSTSTPLVGVLFSATLPARFLVGTAFGESVTVDGVTYVETFAGFDAPILVDASNGTFSIDEDELDAVYWSAVDPQGGVVSMFVAPDEDVVGIFDEASKSWSMTFTQTWPLHTVSLSMGGSLQVH